MTHKIVVVYQSLLGIYGDRGNAMVLVKRLQWRGIDAKLTMVEPGAPVPATGSVYLLGGGDPSEIEKAKTAFRAACLGYALAMLAPVIVAVLKSIIGG